MTELYAVRKLEFVEQEDGSFVAETPWGKCELLQDSAEKDPWSWWWIEDKWLEATDAGGADSKEAAIAACNAHHQEVMAKWLRKPTNDEIVSAYHKMISDVEDGFLPTEGVSVADVARRKGNRPFRSDRLERGESLIESEAPQ
jgi:hypothetical protein